MTKDEVKWAMIIGRTLRGKIGKEKAVKSQDIIKGMKNSFNAKISDPRLRKIINFLRTQKIVKWLIATSNGYYIATSREEVLTYIESLKGREEAIRAVRESLESEL